MTARNQTRSHALEMGAATTTTIAIAGGRPGSAGKGKSWRKPVPRYIPSPPPSPPPSSPAQNYARLSVSLGSAMDEMPSMPAGFRESLDKAFGVDGVRPATVVDGRPVTVVESVRPMTIAGAVRPVMAGPVTGRGRRLHHAPTITVMEEESFQEIDLADLREESRTNQRGRMLTVPPEPQSAPHPPSPHTYRPPTPPLPSNKKPRRSDMQISTLMKPAEYQVYPDLAGLGESTSTSEHSTAAHSFSGGNLARHTLPPSLASWLTLQGTLGTATLVDEDASSLPTYYNRKQSTTTLEVDYSQTQSAWRLMKSWTVFVAQKTREFCAFWNSC